MHLAGCGWSQIDDFAGVFVDEEQVLVRMRFLLAAIVLLLLGGVGWALATGPCRRWPDQGHPQAPRDW